MFSFLFYHKISWKQFLQKLRLFVLYGFNDVLVVTGEVEEGSTGPGVWQLNQWLIAQRILSAEEQDSQKQNKPQGKQYNWFSQVSPAAAPLVREIR